MANGSALTEFKQGIEFLRKGRAAEAFECLRHAAAANQENPYYVSFLGVSVARAQRKIAVAIDLCERALALKRNDAQLYLNLAEVYVSAGRREDAVDMLDRGLRNCGFDARIKQLRGSLGTRSSRVLPFLDRGHFLNRSLGRLRHRVLANAQKHAS